MPIIEEIGANQGYNEVTGTLLVLAQLEGLRTHYFQSSGHEKVGLKDQFEALQESVRQEQMEGVKDWLTKSRVYSLSTWEPFGYEKADWFDPE